MDAYAYFFFPSGRSNTIHHRCPRKEYLLKINVCQRDIQSTIDQSNFSSELLMTRYSRILQVVQLFDSVEKDVPIYNMLPTLDIFR